MLTFPNCKINLGLRILDKRADGFHNIESVFFPVPWCDALEIIEAKEFSFESAGRTIDGNLTDNICVKAYRLLKEKFDLPPVKIFLYKNIPIGAGLGGGSSDGAFTLKLLNEKFKLDLSIDELNKYAAQLGSDCPFFIENKPSFVTGRGEILEHIHLKLKGYQLVVIYPAVSINTGWAFRELEARRKINGSAFAETTSLKKVMQMPVKDWKNYLKNDFEEIIFASFPELNLLKKKMNDEGSIYAGMSGSGSTFYCIFNAEKKLSVFLNDFSKQNILSFLIS